MGFTRNQDILSKIMLGSPRQEDISFIKQEDAVPHMRQSKDVSQRILHLLWRQAEIAVGDNEKRLLRGPDLATDDILTLILLGFSKMLSLKVLFVKVGSHKSLDHLLVVS